MTDLMTLHNSAMDLALLGDEALQTGQEDEARKLYEKAFEAERKAAFMAEEMGNPEPGLSILFRSAASLAYQCGMLREAERLVAHALSGNPTKETAVELRDLLQLIYNDNAFAEEENAAEISYKLSIPKAENSLFTTIVKRMGWTASALRSYVSKAAAF